MARVFITGSSDGLGQLAAKSLVEMGHQVVLHARNENRAKSVAKAVPDAEAVLVGDLSSIEETIKLAEQVNALGTFDSIIHNAAIYNIPAEAKGRENLPLMLTINSLAPYILTALITSPARLIYTSSSMHRQGDASIEKLTAISDGKCIPTYSDTKLHDTILAFAVARKWMNTISNAVDPGWVPTKMGGKDATDSLEQGFTTQVWLAVSQNTQAKLSGRLFYHQKEVCINPQAKDEEIQQKFLSVCEQLTGVCFKP